MNILGAAVCSVAQGRCGLGLVRKWSMVGTRRAFVLGDVVCSVVKRTSSWLVLGTAVFGVSCGAVELVGYGWTSWELQSVASPRDVEVWFEYGVEYGWNAAGVVLGAAGRSVAKRTSS